MLKSDEEFFKLSFPSPLEVIGVSNRVGLLLEVKPDLFPSPLEVIGVSNATEDNSGVDFSKFPSPLEETGVSNQNQKKYSQFLVCFRPLSRRLGFLTFE